MNKEGSRFDKGTTTKNKGEDKEIRAEEGIERMHARMRIEGNGREVFREIGGTEAEIWNQDVRKREARGEMRERYTME